MSDFTISPDNAIELRSKYKTAVSEFENGAEQRRSLYENPVRSWRIKFENRTKTTYDTVKSFFETKRGRYASFTWTNPADNTEYTVRFAEDEIALIRRFANIYSFEFTFIEVR
jgi:phage-related protein